MVPTEVAERVAYRSKCWLKGSGIMEMSTPWLLSRLENLLHALGLIIQRSEDSEQPSPLPVQGRASLILVSALQGLMVYLECPELSSRMQGFNPKWIDAQQSCSRVMLLTCNPRADSSIWLLQMWSWFNASFWKLKSLAQSSSNTGASHKMSVLA